MFRNGTTGANGLYLVGDTDDLLRPYSGGGGAPPTTAAAADTSSSVAAVSPSGASVRSPVADGSVAGTETTTVGSTGEAGGE